eukprot:scaffold9330_cov157-Skeletonema_dohrnii-CCMP3373.AAC.2
MAAANAAKKKRNKRNKRNKAAVKPEKTRLMSWLGGGILPLTLIVMAAFGSITTLIAFSLIHHSNGSSEGEDPPTLPPSASKSLGQRDLQSNIIASASPTSLSSLPVAVVVQAPVIPAAQNSPTNSPVPSSTCLDTPKWKDMFDDGCDWYIANSVAGCPDSDNFAGELGPASRVPKLLFLWRRESYSSSHHLSNNLKLAINMH